MQLEDQFEVLLRSVDCKAETFFYSFQQINLCTQFLIFFIWVCSVHPAVCMAIVTFCVEIIQ